MSGNAATSQTISAQALKGAFICFLVHSPPEVDRMWPVWGSGYNIPKAKF